TNSFARTLVGSFTVSLLLPSDQIILADLPAEQAAIEIQAGLTGELVKVAEQRSGRPVEMEDARRILAARAGDAVGEGRVRVEQAGLAAGRLLVQAATQTGGQLLHHVQQQGGIVLGKFAALVEIDQGGQRSLLAGGQQEDAPGGGGEAGAAGQARFV